GEICCLDADGRSNFKNLLFGREWPHLFAFDILAVNGRDLRGLTLVERKRVLVNVMPKLESRIRYLDHIPARGVELYKLACQRDLEGIVAKWAHGNYKGDGTGTSWMKIKNPEYSQMHGRRDLFDARQRRAPRRRARRAPELRLRWLGRGRLLVARRT